MFQIELRNIGKKFYHNWLFKEIECSLTSGSRLALVGPNGSGKSTLMRIIAGQLAPTHGKITYTKGKMSVKVEGVYRHMSWSGPYVELYRDLNLSEHLRLHFRFKPCLLSHPDELIDILKLGEHKNKKLGFYSSGMLQRVKVGLALFTKSEALLLDEPTSNMDVDNASRMLSLIETHLGDRIFVLASNMEREFGGMEKVIRLGS